MAQPQNNQTLSIIAVAIAVVVIGFFVAGPFYQIQEGEQAVITQFGEAVGTETTAGLKFKIPLIQEANVFPKKIMSWDGEPQLIPTQENQFIWVDSTARWRITDLNKFYESTKTLSRAYSRLDEIIDPAVRKVISTNPLQEAVRSTDIINETKRGGALTGANGEEIEALKSLISSNTDFNAIKTGRRKIAQEVLAGVKANIQAQFGIEIIDVLIRQIRYSDQLTESVYSRMITERKQLAEGYRSYGQGKKQELLGKMEREKKSLLSEAYAKAEGVKGDADAKAARIYSDAYGSDAEFYNFWKSIESYKTTMPQFQKTMTTDMDYFKYLYSPRGR
jgi:membrane protease subunit HflC